VTTKKWGYPLDYKSQTVFEPNNKKRYAESSTGSSISLTNILVNVLFWYGLFFTAAYYWGARQVKQAPKK
jgi:hypothetical protein